MSHEYLINKITADANLEAKKIIADAKNISKENTQYARAHSAELIKDAENANKKRKEREKEAHEGNKAINEKIQVLNQKTKIVNEVFASAFDKIKFNWRVEDSKNYEIRYTKESLMAQLRNEIERIVAEVLFA